MTESTGALLFVSLTLLSSPADVQGQARSPADVARVFFQALESRRWDRAAALILPDLLEDYRSRRLAALEASSTRPDSLAPRLNDQVGEPVEEASLDQLRELSAAELMARHLKAIDGREACAEITGRDYAAPLVRRRVLGVVQEGEWAHVVYRESQVNLDLGAPSDFYRMSARALLLRNTPEGWRIADVDGLGAGIFCDPLIVPREFPWTDRPR